MRTRGRACWAWAALVGVAASPLSPRGELRAQQTGTSRGGRAAVEALVFDPLTFDAPDPRRLQVAGVPVFFLSDESLPLVDIVALFEGGYARFGRENYAAGLALPSLLRTGGTRTLTADSVEALIEGLALQTSFGGGGGAISSALNSLTATLTPALELWWEMVLEPRFDSAEVAVWLGRELESVLRRVDDPGRLAFSEFNRLMYGDHPIGWEPTAADLEPDDLSAARLHAIHARIVCRDNLVLGVSGDVTWDSIRGRIEAMVLALPPCREPVPEAPLPDIRRAGGVFVIPRPIDQSTVVVAHTTALRQGATPEFFASRIGNAILGASGFSSRLLSRLRTEHGYAYSASSLWTTPDDSDGLVGATTRTAAGTTVAALDLILETFDEMRTVAPESSEVRDAIDVAVNGFVFAFESSSQIVARQVSYEASELPRDWLQRYLDGIQSVTPDDVRAAFDEYLDPPRFTVLVVGDPERFDGSLDTLGLGPATILDPDRPASAPGGSPRSRR